MGGADFRAQAEQVFANLCRALASVGAGFGDIVKTTTLIPVATLARPELLVEIEAVAVLSKPAGDPSRP